MIKTCCSSIWMPSWSLLLLSSLSLLSLSHSIILSCRRPLSRVISCWNKATLPGAGVWVRVGPADARPFDSFNFWHKPLTYSSLLESYFCHFEFKLSTWEGTKACIYDVNRQKWHDIFQECFTLFCLSIKGTKWHFLQMKRVKQMSVGDDQITVPSCEPYICNSLFKLVVLLF